MTQPSPDGSGASPGEPTTVLDHLVCHCQLSAFSVTRLALCGWDLTAEDLENEETGPPCVVCVDLAPPVVAARRCERCPT